MHYRRNPEFLGIEMSDVGFAAAGLSAAAIADDKIIAPLIDRFVPSLQNSRAIRKGVDGLTTLLCSYGLGVAAAHVRPRWGAMFQFGGFILGVSRLVSAVIPSYQLSSSTPIDAQLSSLVAGKAAAAAVQSTASAPMLGAGMSPSFSGDIMAVGSPAYSFKGGA